MEFDEKLRILFETKLMEVSVNTPFSIDSMLKNCIREIIEGFSIPPHFLAKPVLKKWEKTSIIYCIVGEKALNDNENNEALKAFTNALLFAPPTSKIIAHCYFWRSVALQKLKENSESLKDIDRALQLSLTITKAQKSNLLKRKKIIQDLLLKESKEKLTKNLNKKEYSKEEITLSYGESEEILGVSSAIALVYNKKYGRHFVATRDIKVGDVLMIQKPYMFSAIKEGNVDPEDEQWICDNCLHSTKAPIPCEGCTLYLYCSFDCRSEAFIKFHKTECKLANIRPPIGPRTSMFRRTLLMATNQGERFQEIANLMEKIKNCKDKRTAGFKDGKLDGKSVNAVLSLLSHMDKQQLLLIIGHSAAIATDLKKHTDFFKKNDDVYTLGKLLLYLSYICHMNVYGIRRSNFDDVIAFGLYPIFNLLNHSCACNTLSYDDKHRNKILKACKNIEKGEQIYVSYNTFQACFMTTKERRKLLLKYKFFMCECIACERDYTYKPELRGVLKVPAQLKKRLIEKPNDTDSLWELLKLVLNEYKHPSMEAKMIELALINAPMGSKNEDLCETLRYLLIF